LSEIAEVAHHLGPARILYTFTVRATPIMGLLAHKTALWRTLKKFVL
jgi:hypothetical protein